MHHFVSILAQLLLASAVHMDLFQQLFALFEVEVDLLLAQLSNANLIV